MKTTELRQKDAAGIETEIKALQKAHFGLRMQKATQQLTYTNTLRTTRRAIARGITVGVLLEVNESGEASKSGCDPQAAVDIAAQIAQAKTMLPEGHTFKSVGSYQIEEDVPAGNSVFNRNKTFGKQHTSFVVRFTEDGKETESSAGKTSYIYYEAEVTVEPDGTLSIEEN